MTERVRRYVLPFMVGYGRINRYAGVWYEVVCQPNGDEICRLNPHEDGTFETTDGENWRKAQ